MSLCHARSCASRCRVSLAEKSVELINLQEELTAYTEGLQSLAMRFKPGQKTRDWGFKWATGGKAQDFSDDEAVTTRSSKCASAGGVAITQQVQGLQRRGIYVSMGDSAASARSAKRGSEKRRRGPRRGERRRRAPPSKMSRCRTLSSERPAQPVISLRTGRRQLPPRRLPPPRAFTGRYSYPAWPDGTHHGRPAADPAPRGTASNRALAVSRGRS